MKFLVVGFLLLLSELVMSARILAIFPHLGKSHFYMFDPLLKALAARGHELVVISAFPQKTPVARYTDINVEPALPLPYVNDVPMGDFGRENPSESLYFLMALANFTCEQVLSYGPVQKLIQSPQKFDLILYETFNTDCFLGFAHKFKAPTIAVFSSTLMPWTTDRFGQPDNPSYIANHFLPLSDRMNFLERFKNTVYYVGIRVFYKLFSEIPANNIARKYFGEDLPPLQDIAANTSLMLVNTHLSFYPARPLAPNIIQVAGLHIQPPTKLPQDIEKFLNDAKDGVIYFCLGSTIRTSTMPKHILDEFLAAFSELPQRILWKWEEDTLPGKPDNVKTSKWLSQMAVLTHPNVKVFLNHGGLMGTIEAIQSGVPMVSIPMFGDQYHNVEVCVARGIALKLPYTTINKETILSALREVLNNPQYRENAITTSRLYHDRPQSALDTALYWTEYVIRHRGAPHLRSAAVELNLVQYLLLDVFAVLLLAVTLLLYVVVLVTKSLLRLCRRSARTTAPPKKTAKKKQKSH